MIGHTGSGKTETARRLAKIADAPFVKVEATSYTEVGIVGPNVKSMVDDLVEVAYTLLKEKLEESIKFLSRKRALEVVAKLITDSAEKPRADFLDQLDQGSFDNHHVDLSDYDHPQSKVFVPALQKEFVLSSPSKR